MLWGYLLQHAIGEFGDFQGYSEWGRVYAVFSIFCAPLYVFGSYYFVLGVWYSWRELAVAGGVVLLLCAFVYVCSNGRFYVVWFFFLKLLFVWWYC